MLGTGEQVFGRAVEYVAGLVGCLGGRGLSEWVS